MPALDAPIERIDASAYLIPTDRPESDGTIAWDSTTLVVAEVAAGGHVGIGYSHADASAADLIRRVFTGAVSDLDAMDTPRCWEALRSTVRNLIRPDRSRPGLGLDLKRADAERFAT